eukprot:CAMPEP_0202872588 /NCGR_PEP_ID=MMETSP1391-20130828/21565_1 /ASSEMBLY_ACC=CAM_ASM_000867 /TAXON_ID=1034604 /ORGANISM="Chlamydomonas leiostraca, Strain SAG 11-49" /LENGTH=57 /DNA_ID=CAMNT_0049553669 /DNA_START=17 /DNA_END=187 /DNA_ORIENTATION=-
MLALSAVWTVITSPASSTTTDRAEALEAGIARHALAADSWSDAALPTRTSLHSPDSM